MPLTPPRLDNDEGDQCARLLELVKHISSHLDVTALCHKIFLHIHGVIAADRYSLFLVCEDSSNDKFLISRLFDVAEGSTLEEASNNCIHLECNKGIVGHVAALGELLNIKDAYEDPRFNAEVDQITGYKTQSILCMPIKNHREEEFLDRVFCLSTTVRVLAFGLDNCICADATGTGSWDRQTSQPATAGPGTPPCSGPPFS
nr:cGMP-specific 3',5'-cyclic phosphodiesterase-like [Equus asinus]